MGEKRNFAALDWVVNEISETLKEARQSLEAYVEDPKDTTRIRFCLTHIHQVHGSLQMVEFHGAALLAEEMEKTAQAIMDQNVASIPEAQEVLMRSLLQLPIFLEHVKNTRDDSPLRILPLLNDMRAVRKQSYLSETDLFLPDLSSIQVPQGKRHPVLGDKKKLSQVIKKLREMYQFAAASVLRGIKIEENLAYLDKVFQRLELISTGTLSHPTWEACATLVDALKRDELELTVGVKGLLRYIAREMRLVGEKAPEIFDLAPRESLLKNLLYYIARAEAGSEKVAKLKQKYGLEIALAGGIGKDDPSKGGMVQSPDADAIRSVVVALQDEIGNIKHVLELSLSGQGSVNDIKEVLPSVKRVADTLAVLGIGDLRKQMLDQTERLETIANSNSMDEDALMETANRIIDIEHRLSAIGKSAGKQEDLSNIDEREVEIDNAKAAVVKECAAGLMKSKESIIDYISSQWDKQHLQEVDVALHDIEGGLNMIPLRRPAGIVGACGAFIKEKLIDGTEHPSFQELEALADAIASVEYYLERLMENLHEDSDAMLEVAEESIANLGYAVEYTPPVVTSEAEAPLAVPEVSESAPQETPLPDDTSNAAEAEAAPEPSAPEVQEQVQAEVEETPAEAVTPANIPAAQPAEETVESDIDDEIIEIFIEEAGEVLETLQEFYPQWKSNNTDQDALVVVRRAFHTLKGSGRMVEAYDIGELAWSVENMLNRVIDRTIKVTPHVFNLIDAVIEITPALVSAFDRRVVNPYKEITSHYESLGQQLAEGNPPTELENPLPAYESVAAPVVAPTGASTTQIAVEEEEEVDTVLQEIFSQESATHLETLQNFIKDMEEEAPVYGVPTDEFQRALHTLKGSAKMAQVWPIAKIAEPLELYMKELITFQIDIDADTLQLIRDAAEYTQMGVSQIEAGEKVEIPKLDQFVARVGELRTILVGHLVMPHDVKVAAEAKGQDVDPRMLSLVMAEEMALLLEADSVLNQWQQDNTTDEVLKRILEELSVLEEGARQAKLNDMASLSALLREAYEKALAHHIATDDHFFNMLRKGHEALLDMVDAVAAAQNVQAPPIEITEGIQQLIDSASKAIVESEPAESEQSGDLEQDDTVISPIPETTIEPSVEEAVSEKVEEAFGEQAEESHGASALEVESTPEEISFEALVEDSAHASETEVQEEPQPLAEEPQPEVEEVQLEVDELQPVAEEPQPEVEEPQPVAEELQPEAEEPEPEAAAPTGDGVVIPGLIDIMDVNDEDYDGDIVEIFLEEAEELVESLDEAIHSWEDDYSDEAAVEEIKRVLHTLKGGARLAGMENLGGVTHDYETMLIEMRDFSNIDDAFFKTVHGYQDTILNAVRAVKQFIDGGFERVEIADASAQPATAPEEVVTELAPDQTKASVEEVPEAAPESEDANVVKFEPKPKSEPKPPAAPKPAAAVPSFEMPSVSGGGGQAAAAAPAKKAAPQEMVKISAELLEELVNLAGETSINRSRLEQYINDFGFSLEEIDTTLSRLQDQLRRLDMETEAQILFRQEQMEQHDDFDPLEMDRYSHLQQLSRSLIESASDLADLKGDLNERLKVTETLLLQQSRVNTTLQEGLMRSRMVPFSRLVPRLRRIVRQVAAELGKNVSFELDNVEGELDRSVLERMVPPFEHMLRNAVDHGIESPEDRAQSGKSESGRIVLTLAREGGDVIIRLADDGRGVNLQRVREKAIERGLMAEDAELADHDIMQFILHAGFSTAEKVSQISGRGVGMDVVHAEIKQLGGSVTINSEWGKGTEFVVRLPFTLSVNRALMVAIGGDHYAVPLSSIEGIVRISPFELEHYYSNSDAQFEYASENYHVRYLGALLKRGTQATLTGHVLPLPVLLVRSAEHTMALQVDAVMGSREIVVKSLGQQFSTVPGLSGATVMGDGSVVVILDPHALVRQEIARASILIDGTELQDSAEQIEDQRIRQIMVVDDSVTVRKVTTRFLEREGFEVVTAKDGVDAIRLLQEGVPDLMLLDIEMPRMDGFEVAKTVRATKRWEDLPIIMITSRTGDKHREHALSLGVNNYLGKPYQEDILLEAIGDILGQTGVRV
ncbi:MAG: Hpt domain-containing protein [Agarilytica sp.]